MERFVDLGCHVAFGGAATFRRNDEVREAFAVCPLDRLLLETELPLHGARGRSRGPRCKPAMIAQTADTLVYDRCDRTGEFPSTITRALWDNSVALFRVKGGVAICNT